MSGPSILTHEYILKGTEPFENADVSVSQFMFDQLKNNRGDCIVHAETGLEFPQAQILQNATSIAEALKTKGIKPNDVIGICSENRQEFAATSLGILFAGATVSPLSPLYTPDELVHVMSISKPRMVFCSMFVGMKFQEVQPKLPFLSELILFDDVEGSEGFTRYTDLIKKRVDLNTFECIKVCPEETVALILCSSGTTGLPKCVDLTHSNLMCFVNAISKSDFLDVSITSGFLGLIPFFHGYGFGVMLCCLAFGVKLIAMATFDEEIFLSSIQKYRIANLCAVPPLILFLAKHPLVDKYDLSSLNNIYCGAAPLSKDVQLAAEQRLKLKGRLVQAYGMTETSIAVTIMPKNKSKIGSVGVVIGGMECKIIDPETGKALPPFTEGELCFKGPFIMKGYRGNPTATMETIDSNGWLHTGDIGYYDEEGYLFIVDRLKELIKYKGFQVAPAELEALLLSNPKIKDVAVIGIPDEEAGELPMAFVVKQPGVNITEVEVKSFVAGKLSPQKRLHEIRFVDEIPKNPSGKILRRKLREAIKSKL